MSVLNRVLICLVGAGLMAGGAAQAADNPVVAPAEVGRHIMFSQDPAGGGDSCTLDASETRIYKIMDHGCKQDQMTYYKLDNVRSAVLIELESKDCTDHGGWIFRLKTYIDPISTEWQSIPALRGMKVGSIVTRGVRKEDGSRENEGNIKGKLSCVRITVSPLP